MVVRSLGIAHVRCELTLPLSCILKTESGHLKSLPSLCFIRSEFGRQLPPRRLARVPGLPVLTIAHECSVGLGGLEGFSLLKPESLKPGYGLEGLAVTTF